MFLGTFTPRLDEKSRLILPAKFRDELAGGLVVTKGQERCLFVFPRRAFEELTAAVAAAPLTSAGPRHYARMLFSSAHDEVPDKQGRITIPAPLRSYAGIERDLAVVGANNRLEIWAADAWTRYTEAQDETFADLPDGLVF